jgi:hypothetical protein
VFRSVREKFCGGMCINFDCFARDWSCQDGFRSSPSGRPRFPPRQGRSVGARREERGAGSGEFALEPRVIRRLRCGASSRRSGPRRSPRRRRLTPRRDGRQGVRPADVRGSPGAGRGTAMRPSYEDHRLRGTRRRGRPGRGARRCDAVASSAFPLCPPVPRDTSRPPRSAPARHPCPRCASPGTHAETSTANSSRSITMRKPYGDPDADTLPPRRPLPRAFRRVRSPVSRSTDPARRSSTAPLRAEPRTACHRQDHPVRVTVLRPPSYARPAPVVGWAPGATDRRQGWPRRRRPR